MSTISNNPEAQDLIDAFSFLGDWDARYQFIIDLGRKLPPMDAALKTEGSRVHGCQSTVHMISRIEDGKLEFIAESDAAIVNGLIAILEKVYNDTTPSEVLAFDVETFLQQLGLEEHLSPTRRNGLHEMVKRIRKLATLHAENHSP